MTPDLRAVLEEALRLHEQVGGSFTFDGTPLLEWKQLVRLIALARQPAAQPGE